jgi:hypothetical protein
MMKGPSHRELSSFVLDAMKDQITDAEGSLLDVVVVVASDALEVAG